MTISVAGLKRSSKALLRAKLEPKEGHGHCLVACCPPDQLQLSECQLKHYIKVHSANRWDAPKTVTPAASMGQQNGPNSFPWQCLTTGHTIHTSKAEWIWLQSFASSAIFTWPLTNWPPLLQASQHLRLQGKHFHSQQEAKSGKVCRIPKHGF